MLSHFQKITKTAITSQDWRQFLKVRSAR